MKNFSKVILLLFVVVGLVGGQFAIAKGLPSLPPLPPAPGLSNQPSGLPDKPTSVPQINYGNNNSNPDNGFIEGKVINADTREPIANARVIIPELGKSLKSDAQGNFKFDPLGVKDKKEGDYVTLKVIAPGFGEHTMVDVGVYPGNTATVTLELKKGNKPTKWWGVMRPEERRRRPPEPAPSPDEGTITALYSSQTVPPAQIRVAIRSICTGTEGYKCDVGKPNPKGAVLRTDTVDFDFYVKHVLPQEWQSGWASSSLMAGAMAAKDYGWYWVNKGGKWPVSIPGVDVDNSINTQVYNPNVSYSDTDKAVDDTAANGWYQNGVIFESQYRGDGIYGPSSSCGIPNCMTQDGSHYWADQGKDYKWILNYYYEPDPTYFNIVPPRPLLAASRASYDITLTFSSPAATWYLLDKWMGDHWEVIYSGPNKSFTDTNVAMNHGYYYTAIAWNPAGWGSAWSSNNGYIFGTPKVPNNLPAPITDPFYITKDQIGLRVKSLYTTVSWYTVFKKIGGYWQNIYYGPATVLDPNCVKRVWNGSYYICYPLPADQQLPNPYVDSRDWSFYFFDKNLSANTGYTYTVAVWDSMLGWSDWTNYNGYIYAVTQPAN